MKGGYVMKKSRISVIALMVVLTVSFLWLTGCATKAVQQGETAAQPAAATKVEPAKPAAQPDAVAKETKAAVAEAAPAPTFADVYFDFDKSVLRAKDRDVLKGHAAAMMKNKNYTVVIEGNCDERGTTEYNLALGERRANEAAKYLISLGVEKDRVKTISYGKERPADPGHNEEAWAKNRRDHFVVKLK